MPRQQQKPLERWGGGGWHACMHEVHSVHSTDGIFNDSVTVQYMGVPLHLTILFSYCLCTQKVVPAFSVKNEWKKKRVNVAYSQSTSHCSRSYCGKRYEYKGFRKFCCVLCYMSPCFPGGSEVKASAWNAESQVQSLGREDSLEKEMATHSSTLAWRIPWREEPGRLQSMGSLRVHQGCALRKIQFRDKRILALDSKDA